MWPPGVPGGIHYLRQLRSWPALLWRSVSVRSQAPTAPRCQPSVSAKRARQRRAPSLPEALSRRGCQDARDRSSSPADHVGGAKIALLRHLRTTQPLDRSVSDHPTSIPARPTFKKLRFQMIANSLKGALKLMLRHNRRMTPITPQLPPMPKPEDFGITDEDWRVYSHGHDAARGSKRKIDAYKEALKVWENVCSGKT